MRRAKNSLAVSVLCMVLALGCSDLNKVIRLKSKFRRSPAAFKGFAKSNDKKKPKAQLMLAQMKVGEFSTSMNKITFRTLYYIHDKYSLIYTNFRLYNCNFFHSFFRFILPLFHSHARIRLYRVLWGVSQLPHSSNIKCHSNN